MNNDNYGVDFIARCIAAEAYEMAESGAGITIDAALSTTSENPVQNKVITNELSYKPDTYANNTKVANQKIVQLTKNQFDAIQNKDTNTYYMITDDTTADQYTAGTGIDITNGVISLDVNYGATLELDVNSSTYVVTATLRDQNNQVLSTDTIDLPLESVVVSGSYDSQTEKIILTLQNGNTIEFSVASLVSGLEETSNKVTSISNASTNTEYPSAAAVYSFVNGLSYDEVPAVGSSDDGKVLTADYTGGTGSYSWETPATPADMATQTWVGQQGYLTSADEVPAVGSSDDGKILTASYSGGSGSYAWANPQTFSQQQADWTQSDNSAVDYIKNKPSLAAVATSGSYSDLSGTPNLATVATSGDYTDLTNKPTIPAAQVNADWNASTGVAEILNKPTLGTAAAASTSDFATAAQGTKADTAVQPGDLATVATTGSYSDLSNKPTIPAAQVNADWNSSSGVSEILNKPSLAAVATSGSYTDLSNTPTIPAAQVQSDWNAVSGMGVILNKPSLAAVATSGSYTDLSNTPTIPDGVPTVTSSDDGKVLKATYSGGTGSYAWATEYSYTLPYASQSTKGGVRAWTTTEGGETVLNIATQD